MTWGRVPLKISTKSSIKTRTVKIKIKYIHRKISIRRYPIPNYRPEEPKLKRCDTVEVADILG
jgi:hypothetical protein